MSANETVVVTSPLGNGKLRLRSLFMSDALSRPYEIQLILSSLDFDLDFDKLLGTGLNVQIDLPEGAKRHFHGLVAQIELAGAAPRAATYRVSVRPWLWFMRHTSDCRIFQNKTVPEIIEQTFKDNGFSDFKRELTGSYERREYCVQYCESDFDFVSRLMENEGIYYYFRHEREKHTLVLCDSIKAHASVERYEKIRYRPEQNAGRHQYEEITEWREAREVAPGACVLGDYDFKKPKAKLEAHSAGRARHQRGDFEVFDYPGSFSEVKRGELYAKLRREALQVPVQRYLGAGNPRGVGVGNTFALSDHPRERLNKEYLVVGAEHELLSEEHEMGTAADLSSFAISSRFTAIDVTHPFRPPRITPRPGIRGPQTALVVGPEKQEIHTDKYGRIRVKFPWDRLGKSDETASCWVRVSQAWAGNKWGHFFLPRIGQEVIVDFFDGDPDRPIVTGMVHNTDQMPPYDLPAAQTRSTIKTRSTPGGDDNAFNELRFEDKKGEEEIYIHAERDFTRVVENNDTLKVGFDKKSDGNQTIDIYNNQTTTVGKDRDTTVKAGDDVLRISQGNRSTTINGDDLVTLKTGSQEVAIEAGAQSTEALRSITLKVGQNSITIDQTGITIKAIQVKVEAQTMLDLKGLLTTLKGDAMTFVKGAIVMVN
jgi:type VI secretion system secreted protein VgrG